MKTVGVMGDGRTYDYALALRAVTSVDGMTADYYPFTHDFLGETATRIINEVKGINRVFYDCTSQTARHDRVGMITVTGHLIAANEPEADLVRRYLPDHIRLAAPNRVA